MAPPSRWSGDSQCRMGKVPEFKRLLAHPIQPTGGPPVLLVTLEDAAKFIGLMEPWRQARP
jgi:hypothetical protein